MSQSVHALRIKKVVLNWFVKQFFEGHGGDCATVFP